MPVPRKGTGIVHGVFTLSRDPEDRTPTGYRNLIPPDGVSTAHSREWENLYAVPICGQEESRTIWGTLERASNAPCPGRRCRDRSHVRGGPDLQLRQLRRWRIRGGEPPRDGRTGERWRALGLQSSVR